MRVHECPKYSEIFKKHRLPGMFGTMIWSCMSILDSYKLYALCFIPAPLSLQRKMNKRQGVSFIPRKGVHPLLNRYLSLKQASSPNASPCRRYRFSYLTYQHHFGAMFSHTLERLCWYHEIQKQESPLLPYPRPFPPLIIYSITRRTSSASTANTLYRLILLHLCLWHSAYARRIEVRFFSLHTAETAQLERVSLCLSQTTPSPAPSKHRSKS